MNKKIIHFKIPTFRENIIISAELIGKFLKLIKDALGEEYLVIASPFDPSWTDGSVFYNFDMEQLDVEGLINLVERRDKNYENDSGS